MADDKPFRRGGELIVGRIVAHSAANYEFRSDQSPSYYLKLLTSRGERVIWGKGLQGALERSPAKPKLAGVIGDSCSDLCRNRELVSKCSEIVYYRHWKRT